MRRIQTPAATGEIVSGPGYELGSVTMMPEVLKAHGADVNLPTMRPAGRPQTGDSDRTNVADISGQPPVPIGGQGHRVSGQLCPDCFQLFARQHLRL